MDFKALARNTKKLKTLGLSSSQIINAQLTAPRSLIGCCEGIETVLSTVGITRQKDGLTYMEVDYQANINLLEEAKKSGVKKFIYVSVLHGEKLKHLEICAAKERFVEALQKSGLDYCIIRPSGFFSDMKSFFDMAKKGRVYLFGDGTTKANPIHGADLAKVCVDAISQHAQVLEVGGKEVLSHLDIANSAFQTLGKKPKITFIPDGLRRFSLRLAALVLNKTSFGPVQFFLHVMAMDMTTNPYGQYTILEFFNQLAAESRR